MELPAHHPSTIQFELVRTCDPFAGVTVLHGSLREGHVPVCVDEDDCVCPDWEEESEHFHTVQTSDLRLR